MGLWRRTFFSLLFLRAGRSIAVLRALCRRFDAFASQFKRSANELRGERADPEGARRGEARESIQPAGRRRFFSEDAPFALSSRRSRKVLTRAKGIFALQTRNRVFAGLRRINAFLPVRRKGGIVPIALPPESPVSGFAPCAAMPESKRLHELRGNCKCAARFIRGAQIKRPRESADKFLLSLAGGRPDYSAEEWGSVCRLSCQYCAGLMSGFCGAAVLMAVALPGREKALRKRHAL